MVRVLVAGVFAALLPFPAVRAGEKADDAKLLQGVWVASSVEVDGQAMPKEAVERTRFTFKGDKLLVHGDENAEKAEVECSFKLTAKESPKQLDITTPEGGGTMLLGIYEVKGDELKLCFRHPKSKGGRPEKFETAADSESTLIVFQRKKK